MAGVTRSRVRHRGMACALGRKCAQRRVGHRRAQRRWADRDQRHNDGILGAAHGWLRRLERPRLGNAEHLDRPGLGECPRARRSRRVPPRHRKQLQRRRRSNRAMPAGRCVRDARRLHLRASRGFAFLHGQGAASGDGSARTGGVAVLHRRVAGWTDRLRSRDHGDGLPPVSDIGAYAGYEAWLATPNLDVVRRLGTIQNDSTLHADADWNKFTVIVTERERRRSDRSGVVRS